MRTLVSLALSATLLALLTPVCRAEKEGGLMARIKWTRGPDKGNLEKRAEIEVPDGFLFAQGDDTRLLMRAMGNLTSGNEVGFLAPTSMVWFVVFEFDEVGYVKDDEKASLDADAMLESIKKGTEQANEVRRKHGAPGLTIVGWDLKPTYNEKTHNLEWCIRAKDDSGQLVVNHNTRILGRSGVMKATLVASPDVLTEVMPLYVARLGTFGFVSGEKYAEYRKGDKIAKYGLTALVVGGATAVAAKTGLLKSLWKVIVVGAIAVGAFFKKLFGRKSQ
jgi:uncharacterized membrane-anchored protein